MFFSAKPFCSRSSGSLKLVTICDYCEFHNFRNLWIILWCLQAGIVIGMVVARNIQNKNITTTTIGTITLGLNNMFVFETFVEHHLELTLGTDVQFKPPSRSNNFYRRSMQFLFGVILTLWKSLISATTSCLQISIHFLLNLFNVILLF